MDEREIPAASASASGREGNGGDSGSGNARDPRDVEGYEMPNVKFHALDDEDTLMRVQRDDPEVLGLHGEWRDYDDKPIDWWRRVGCSIGRNTRLRALKLDLLTSRMLVSFDAFCQGLANNRSIEVLVCNGSPAREFSKLAPFFACNPRLRCVAIKKTSGRSASLLTATLSNCSEHSLKRIKVKCAGLSDEGAAKFIESLYRQQNLVALTLSDVGMGPRGCAALSKLIRTSTMRLQELDISGNRYIDDESIANVTSALAKKCDLKKLTLGAKKNSVAMHWRERRDSISVTPNGWSVVFTNLYHPLRSIQRLSLYCICLNNEAAMALGHALDTNRSLTHLNLNLAENISAAAWNAISLCWQHPESVLEHLNMYSCIITVEGVIAVGNALAGHRKLKSLNMGRIGNAINPTGWYRSTVCPTGWHALSQCLHHSDTALEELDLSGCNINDHDAIAMATRLRSAGNTTLKTLNLGDNETITPVGWRRFFDLLLRSELRLESLLLSRTNIDDEGAAILVDFCLRSETLKCLLVSDCQLISATGWQVFVNLVQSPTSALEYLHTSLGAPFADHSSEELLVSYADALADNTSLKVLAFDMGGNGRTRRWGQLLPEPTAGWDALSRALCDTATINETYSSNHTLQTVKEYSWLGSDVPSDVSSFLRMNQTSNKAAVARRKILLCHFSGPGPSIQAFAGFKREVMPCAIEWIGRDHHGFSLLYQLARGMPTLFAPDLKLGQ